MSGHSHFLVVPAWSDQGGQMRVVHARTATPSGLHQVQRGALKLYRENPQFWKEAGLVNSQGKVVCLDADPWMADDIRSAEPLMGGLQFTFEERT